MLWGRQGKTTRSSPGELVGILAGSEGLGGIAFDDPHTAQFVGITALNFILFAGGLSTDFPTIRPVLWKGMALSTVGVLLTAFSVGIFVHYLLGFSLPAGLLLGAIVSSTDAAAVFSILREDSSPVANWILRRVGLGEMGSGGIGLKGNLRPLLELESGSNDPGLFSYYFPDGSGKGRSFACGGAATVVL
ncbi:MAG TPA: cation:proton antiporter [Puia sp.]